MMPVHDTCEASQPGLLIYLLTANGLTPGGSSTVHIYTQTIHRTTQLTNRQHHLLSEHAHKNNFLLEDYLHHTLGTSQKQSEIYSSI